MNDDNRLQRSASRQVSSASVSDQTRREVSNPVQQEQQDQNNGQKLTLDDAHKYLDRVKRALSDQPGVYLTFLTVLKQFKTQRLDTLSVIRKIAFILQGNRELILGFNEFMPNNLQILMPREGPSVAIEHQLASGEKVQHVVIDSGLLRTQTPEDPTRLQPTASVPRSAKKRSDRSRCNSASNPIVLDDDDDDDDNKEHTEPENSGTNSQYVDGNKKMQHKPKQNPTGRFAVGSVERTGVSLRPSEQTDPPPAKERISSHSTVPPQQRKQEAKASISTTSKPLPQYLAAATSHQQSSVSGTFGQHETADPAVPIKLSGLARQTAVASSTKGRAAISGEIEARHKAHTGSLSSQKRGMGSEDEIATPIHSANEAKASSYPPTNSSTATAQHGLISFRRASTRSENSLGPAERQETVIEQSLEVREEETITDKPQGIRAAGYQDFLNSFNVSPSRTSENGQRKQAAANEVEQGDGKHNTKIRRGDEGRDTASQSFAAKQSEKIVTTTLSNGAVMRNSNYNPDGSEKTKKRHSNIDNSSATKEQGRPRAQGAATGVSYLDTVKRQYASRPHVYSEFLYTIRALRKSEIDILEAIQRVYNLLEGKADLVLGFSRFLPDDYTIEVAQAGGPPIVVRREASKKPRRIFSLEGPKRDFPQLRPSQQRQSKASKETPALTHSSQTKNGGHSAKRQGDQRKGQENLRRTNGVSKEKDGKGRFLVGAPLEQEGPTNDEEGVVLRQEPAPPACQPKERKKDRQDSPIRKQQGTDSRTNETRSQKIDHTETGKEPRNEQKESRKNESVGSLQTVQPGVDLRRESHQKEKTGRDLKKGETKAQSESVAEARSNARNGYHSKPQKKGQSRSGNGAMHPLAQRECVENRVTSATGQDFLCWIKEELSSKLEVYTEFLLVLKRFHTKQLDIDAFIRRIVPLFRGNMRLVLAMNNFLPRGHRIEHRPSDLGLAVFVYRKPGSSVAQIFKVGTKPKEPGRTGRKRKKEGIDRLNGGKQRRLTRMLRASPPPASRMMKELTACTPRQSRNLHKSILFRLLSDCSEDAVNLLAGAQGDTRKTADHERPDHCWAPSWLARIPRELSFLASERTGLAFSSQESASSNNAKRANCASKLLKQVESETLDWHAARRVGVNRGALQSFTLHFNECSVAGISRWAGGSPLVAITSNEADGRVTQKRPTVASNFRMCALCGLWGHYEIECTRMTKEQALRFGHELDNRKATEVLSSSPPGSSPSTKTRELANRKGDLVVESCNGYIIEQRASFASSLSTGNFPARKLETKSFNFGGFAIKAGRSAASVASKKKSTFDEGDLVTWFPNTKEGSKQQLQVGVVVAKDATKRKLSVNKRWVVPASCNDTPTAGTLKFGSSVTLPVDALFLVESYRSAKEKRKKSDTGKTNSPQKKKCRRGSM